MSKLKKLINPVFYFYYLKKIQGLIKLMATPNCRSIIEYPPGHYYSPLLDIESITTDATQVLSDGEENWKHVDLREAHQREFYKNMLENVQHIAFPSNKTETFRYFKENAWFVFSDALTLSTIIQVEAPKKLIEVGSGFSSAVILDTLQRSRLAVDLTFIEPFPERLFSLLSDEDKSNASILVSPVQDVSLEVFDQLEAHDILFVDSSHVAKIGSDVSFLILQVLPRLKPGVLVHFHDIFYPHSYPMDWIRSGRAWNESLFLRAFLLGNPKFQIIAFTSFAGKTFPDMFRKHCPEFMQTLGGSIWLEVVDA